jgi:hypothetical protein
MNCGQTSIRQNSFFANPPSFIPTRIALQTMSCKMPEFLDKSLSPFCLHQGLFSSDWPQANISFSPKNSFFIKIFSENSIEHTLATGWK